MYIDGLVGASLEPFPAAVYINALSLAELRTD